MGFLNALQAMGGLNPASGWEAYLMFPLAEPTSKSTAAAKNKKKPDDGHKIIRVWLNVEDPTADQLKVVGVEKIDLMDYKVTPEMKRRYLYRDKVGANTTWGFSPILKIGKPKKDIDARLKFLVGDTGNWRQDHESTYNKLKHRLLDDFETRGVLSPGSVEAIMNDLSDHVNHVCELFDGNGSFIILFGVNNDGMFQYPGDLPPFVAYFRDKLATNIQNSHGNGDAFSGNCYCCGQQSTSLATLDKVFKFATFDKVNVLPGLEKENRIKVQPVCQRCLEDLTAGRELIERELTDKSKIPRLNIWVIPEVVGPQESGKVLAQAVRKLKSKENVASGMGAEAERRLFDKLKEQGSGIVFHFLFWEPSYAQERVHLMLEDVPPSRLAALDTAWKSVCKDMDFEWDTTLDGAFSAIYTTCIALSGAGDDRGDKAVMRDFVIKIIGKMMMGQKVSSESFKAMFVGRIPKLVFDSAQWRYVKGIARKAQVVVEFFERVNRRVASI